MVTGGSAKTWLEVFQQFNLDVIVGSNWKFLIALTVLDVFSGVVAALVNKEFNSDVTFIGIARKLGLFIGLALFSFLDLYFSAKGYLLQAGMALLVFYEVASIVENLKKAHLDITFVLGYFQKNDGKKKEKEEEK